MLSNRKGHSWRFNSRSQLVQTLESTLFLCGGPKSTFMVCVRTVLTHGVRMQKCFGFVILLILLP